MNSSKILVIGIDGATFDLIIPWVKEGKLPKFEKLLQDGVHGNLKSVPNMNSAPAWTSFATGKNPGKHGIFYFDELIPRTYQKRYLNGSYRQGKAFWNYAGEFSKKTIIINVPMTYPAEEVNGLMIAGMDTPSVNSPGFTYPPNLAKDIQKITKGYIIEPGIPSIMKKGNKKLAIYKLLETIQKRRCCAEYLMKSHPWDLFVVVFTATDVAQHFFWKYIDPFHPEYDKKSAQKYGETILRVYQEIDKSIGSLLSIAGRVITVLVSDHGAGINQRGAEFLPPWLEQIGFLSYKKSFGLKNLLISLLERGYTLVDKLFLRETKLLLTRLLPGAREAIESLSAFKDFDWSQTKAYSDGIRDEIWINVKGREPYGIVEPGREYDRTCEILIEKLLEVQDSRTGKPVVKKVLKKNEIYWGEFVSKAPDITIIWNSDQIISGLKSPEISSNLPPRKKKANSLISGGHREEGILIMAGPGIKKGTFISSADIYDIAPTLLYLLNIPIPDDMDGHVITKALEENHLTLNPVHYRNYKRKKPLESSKTHDYSRNDEEIIKKRLKDLGYIE